MSNTNSFANPISVARRRLLKSLTVGSGAFTAAQCLPKSWTKPISIP